MTEASGAAIAAVQAIAETLGVHFSHIKGKDSYPAQLAQDAEFRMRQILNPASILVKKAHITKLTADQLNMVLKSLDLDPVYGYNGTSEFKTMSTVVDNECLCGVIDPIIKLEDACKPRKKPRETNLGFSFNWVLVDGAPVEKQYTRSGAPKLLTRDFGVYGINSLDVASLTKVPKQAEQCSPEHEVPIDREMQDYFDSVVECINGSDDKRKRDCYDSLRHHAGLQPLMPHFLQFIASVLTSKLTDTKAVSEVTWTSLALAMNPSLSVHMYVHTFIRIAMTVIMRYETSEDITEDIRLRQLGAKLLLYVCHRSAAGFPHIKTVCINALIKGWLNPSTTHAAQFGALTGIRAMGAEDAIKDHIDSYVATLKREISNPVKEPYITMILDYINSRKPNTC